MPVHLFELDAHPNQIAVSMTDSFVTDGAFFLDFGRPLEVSLRFLGVPPRFGVINKWAGLAIALLVPIIHQSQAQGGFVIGVHISDPCFATLRALWKTHSTSVRHSPTVKAEGCKIVADFAKQFPEQC